MQIDLLTLFPEFFASPLSQSMLHRAQVQGAVTYTVINLRDFATDRHQVTDDRPFGGGPGMVMKIEPLVAAIRMAKEGDPETRVILLGPGGAAFNQAKARELADKSHLLLICGHYEGVDERIHFYIDEELSIGDYILTGGEIPALIVADAVTRLLPGRPPGISPLHPPPDFRRTRGSPGVAGGRPPAHCLVAAPTGHGPDGDAAAGFAVPRRPQQGRPGIHKIPGGLPGGE
jgi:hypothetical protein